MVIFNIHRKCCICKQRTDETISTANSGYYGSKHRYHESCVDTAIKVPEAHTNIQVDIALEIFDIKKDEMKRERNRERQRELRLLQANEYLDGE